MDTILLTTAMSLNERMAYGFQVFVVGMITVFAVLAILYFALLLFKLVFYKEERKQSAPAKPNPAKSSSSPAPAPATSAVPTTTADDTQLIAVITAAIAAYNSENGNTLPFRVVSYKRSSGASGWNSKNI